MGLVDALKMTCKDATYLHEKKKEGKMLMAERIGLSFHLLICKFCRLFFRQMKQIEKSSAYYSVFSEKHQAMDSGRKEVLQKNLNRELGK
jgi:hypothetical protein